MGKIDIAGYLEEVLVEHNLDFDWTVQRNKRQHTIEVYFSISVETESDIVVEDISGTVNNEGSIQIEDAICFYDPLKSKLVLDHYLKAFPFELKRGIEKGYIDTVVKMLRISVTEGQADLLDFATDPSIETFEFKWNESNFEKTVKTLKETDRYNLEIVPYPSY